MNKTLVYAMVLLIVLVLALGMFVFGPSIYWILPLSALIGLSLGVLYARYIA